MNTLATRTALIPTSQISGERRQATVLADTRVPRMSPLHAMRGTAELVDLNQTYHYSVIWSTFLTWPTLCSPAPLDTVPNVAYYMGMGGALGFAYPTRPDSIRKSGEESTRGLDGHPDRRELTP